MMVQILMILAMMVQEPSVYDFSIKTIDGKEVRLEEFRGRPMLIVNTASKCGFTKQYKELQELHQQYGDKVVVIGFPSDNFMGQELDKNEDIQAFCEKNYGVTFLLSEKVDVKGKQMAPLFKYLTSADNPDFTGNIKWNFEKFVIDSNGKLSHRYRSRVTPLSKELVGNLVK